MGEMRDERPFPERGDEEEGSTVRRALHSRPSPLHLLWDWSRSIALAFFLFLFIRAFVVEAFKIPTSSMENTLLVGDFLLVNKMIYGAEIPGTGIRLPALHEPDRGEVVVFNPPHEPERNYVKRLVGLPGDTLEMKDKTLYVNGAPLREPYARYIDAAGDAVHAGMRWQSNYLIAGPSSVPPSRDNWGPLVVPERSFFVLGDNRDNSEDSRYWGFVHREAVRGQPWFVYYSFDPDGDEELPWLKAVRWQRIGSPVR